MSSKIKVVGFEGLHRSGKGTQIALLSDYLYANSLPFEVIRGDGTRRGLGNESYDPRSSWWQNNYSYFFQKEESLEDQIQRRNLLYQRLSREATYHANRRLPQIAKQSNSDCAFLLMDRTFISRLFSMRQIMPHISLDEALTSVNPKNKKKIQSVIPQITFIFNVSKKTLIDRCNPAMDQPDKKEFRRNNLSRYYELYERVVSEIIGDSRFNIQVIDGELSPEKINELIKKYLKI
ncbi:hypothetical protein HYW76_05780 [Candidatus Pacearchaeota archaeon]|nr:hypothetical protein [Candidatus Pacearchaeota archaeon]